MEFVCLLLLIIKQLQINQETYRAGFLGKLKNFIPFCLLDEKHPEAEHVHLLSIYSARGNTTIKTQSRYSESFLLFSGLNQNMYNVP
jgi:hypothetical protein